MHRPSPPFYHFFCFHTRDHQKHRHYTSFYYETANTLLVLGTMLARDIAVVMREENRIADGPLLRTVSGL